MNTLIRKKENLPQIQQHVLHASQNMCVLYNNLLLRICHGFFFSPSGGLVTLLDLDFMKFLG